MSAPFESVLVANRGEIACRIFRTARAMGVRTIAVHSDADAAAKHVREADVAIGIGASAAAASYLRGEAILAAARETGAAAIHPGYGFLSENPGFAEAVLAAGLIWIGPTPAAIRAMGLKDEAKRIAIAAGVPVLPGYQDEDQSEKRLAAAAKEIGFPVLIKAVAGGGGRGIREVHGAGQFRDQLDSARREAKAAFGDDRVLIEKLVERPRHVEVQVFGDRHGQIVHLFERDCSLQRRRQKVIEEAPAPGMTGAVRAAMTEAALRVAKAVAYENAGTVEFIVDGAGPLRPDGFWFLEMNTRLQVEHPVTEAITGLDLVEWQFRVAAGERLPLRQSEIKLHGHAIEARICAEDPAEGFRPSVGLIETFGWLGDGGVIHATPAGARLDHGFEAGDTVSPHYDSLLAKAIVHEETRDAGLETLRASLSLCCEGVATNAAFLARLAEDPAVQAGVADTSYIERELSRLVPAPPVCEALIAAALATHAGPTRGSGPWDAMDGWRLGGAQGALHRFEIAGNQHAVRVRERHPGRNFFPAYDIDLDGERLTAEDVRVGAEDILWFTHGGREMVTAAILRRPGGWSVFRNGQHVSVGLPGTTAEHAGLDAGDDVKAPLPGKIVSLAAAVGAHVRKDAPLVTLEAMKMEHALKAPRDGVIAEVSVREGAQVKEGEILVRLEPA